MHSAIEVIAEIFGIAEWDIEYPPRYNIAPSQDILIVIIKPRDEKKPHAFQKSGDGFWRELIPRPALAGQRGASIMRSRRRESYAAK